MDAGNVICPMAEIDGGGKVTMGMGNVVHPLVKIKAGQGKIVIGSGNNFEEFCEIRNVAEWDGHGEPPVMTIGDGNTFEAGSIIHSSSIGSHNTIRSKAVLLPASKLSDFCTILPKRSVGPGIELPPNTSVYGPNGEIRVKEAEQTPDPEHALTLECLRQTLPNFHEVSTGVDTA